MSQFQADINLYTTADSGPRDPARCQFWCIHTTENSRTTRAEDVATWQQNRANGSSYTGLVGPGGRTVRSNDDNYIPWSAGTVGNARGLHLAFVGRAADSRATWLADDAALRAGAAWVANWCREYGLPNRRIGPMELRRGERGGCGHVDVNQVWSSGATRTDPGPNFPWDVFLRYVNEALNGSPPPPAPPQSTAPDMPPGENIVSIVNDRADYVKLPVEGGVSWFGSTGDASTAGRTMALTGESADTPADPWYCAMRWTYCHWESYREGSEWWLKPIPGTSNLAMKKATADVRVLVTHKPSGKQVVLRAADTGPRPSKRVIDVSPHVLHNVFGGQTDDQVRVELAPQGAALGVYTASQPTTPEPPVEPPQPQPAPRTPIPDPGDVDGRVRDLWFQLFGIDGNRWPQLAGLTAVDAIATIGAHLGIDGFQDMRGK